MNKIFINKKLWKYQENVSRKSGNIWNPSSRITKIFIMNNRQIVVVFTLLNPMIIKWNKTKVKLKERYSQLRGWI